MGHGLGLKVVAEGIETEAAAARLRDFGCDIAQGYLYAKPMPLAALETWLEGKERVPVVAIPVDFKIEDWTDTVNSGDLLTRILACVPPPHSRFRQIRVQYFHMSIASRVNILGEALDGLGRWYVAVPPFLIIGFLAALFFLTGAGQERLQEASERLQKSALREHAIDDLQIGISRSVSAQRSFLLTGDRMYSCRATSAIPPMWNRAWSACRRHTRARMPRLPTCARCTY